MMKAAYDPTDVASIVRSNHTCKLRLRRRLFVGSEEECVMHTINGDIDFGTPVELGTDQNIRKKVVFALCDKPRILSDLLHYLDDSPPGLVPCVLNLIQEQHDSIFSVPSVLKLIQEQHDYMFSSRVKAEKGFLSRLFLALKGWRMLELFEGAPRPLKMARRKRKRYRSS